MGKVYKGWELIKAIADGKIKDNTKIKVSFNTTLIDVIEYKDQRLKWKQDGNFNTEYLCRNTVDFELIKDEEVNIQEMPEDIDEIGWIEVKDKINEIIRVVNKMQLDNNTDKEYCQNCGAKLTKENKYMNGMCCECKYGIDWKEK